MNMFSHIDTIYIPSISQETSPLYPLFLGYKLTIFNHSTNQCSHRFDKNQIPTRWAPVLWPAPYTPHDYGSLHFIWIIFPINPTVNQFMIVMLASTLGPVPARFSPHVFQQIHHLQFYHSNGWYKSSILGVFFNCCTTIICFFVNGHFRYLHLASYGTWYLHFS